MRAVRARGLPAGRVSLSPRADLWVRATITVVACAVALLLPFVLSGYGMSVAITVVTFAMLGLGLNVVVGYAGLLDLGYAAFFAIGAYTSGLLQLYLRLSFWETLPLALAVAAIGGVVIGYPTLRLRSDYLAIVTLGFGEIVRIVAQNLTITGGPNGLYGIPAATVIGHKVLTAGAQYYLGLFLLGCVVVFTGLLARSRLGRAWRSLREDETAAEAVGVPALKVKQMAYIMGSLVGAVAGMFFAARFGAIDPTSFTFQTSELVLVVVIVGGMGSIPGAILGAVLVTVLPEVLRSLADYRMLIFALALIVLMLVRPQGLWPVRRTRRGAFAVRPEEAREIGEMAPVRPAGPQRGELLLRVDDLSHSFGGVRAVDHVSLDISAGEIVSIIGPNGAGKTTLFNCVTGVVTPDSGSVLLQGKRSLRKVPPHRVVRLGLARTFQGIRLFDGLSVAENVLVGRTAHQSGLRFGANGLFAPTTTRDRLEAARWLDFVGLAGKAHLLASELAYGERRRVEIARALASEPVLLLLDEPSAGTNPTEKRELMGLVRQVRDSGVTVALIEHDMGLVMGLSDRVVVLDYGRVIAEGTPEEVRTDQRVIDAYLGREEEEPGAEAVEEVLGWRSLR